MKICQTCNGSGKVDDGLDGPNLPCFVDCESCHGTGKERPPPAFALPPGVHELPSLPRGERIKRAQEMVDEVIALRRVADAARVVEKWMHAHAREANCDVVNDDHEQLRSALHNLDMLVSTSDREK